MRLTHLFTLFLIFAFAFSGMNCDSSVDLGGRRIIKKFVGTWQAKSDLDGTLIEFAKQSDPNTKVDVRILGATISVTVNKSGSYNFTLELPGDPTDSDNGTAIIDQANSMITLQSSDPQEETVIFQYSFEEGMLVLVTIAEFDFDLTGPEPEVPAIVTLKLQKTS
jgi:hypothetical protein